jgi:hypothetical protein
VLPTSFEPSVYVWRVAPATAAQALPAELQRDQLYEYEIGAVPVHEPFEAVRVEPLSVRPEMVGEAVLLGAVGDGPGPGPGGGGSGSGSGSGAGPGSVPHDAVLAEIDDSPEGLPPPM